MKKDKN